MRDLSNCEVPEIPDSGARRRFSRAVDGAFTLIELLVVVAILGILAVFLLMNLTHALRKAYEGRTYAGLSTMRTAMETWKAAEMNNYTYAPGGNSTNGYAWCIREGGGVPYPGLNATNWAPGDMNYDLGSGYTIEKGSHQVYFNRYLENTPPATVGDDQASYGIWITDDVTPDAFSSLTNGVQQTNKLTTDAASSPADGVANVRHRGWHYRNTDGKIRINNTCLSTEGRRYDTY